MIYKIQFFTVQILIVRFCTVQIFNYLIPNFKRPGFYIPDYYVDLLNLVFSEIKSTENYPKIIILISHCFTSVIDQPRSYSNIVKNKCKTHL